MCEAFGPTVQEKKTQKMVTPARTAVAERFHIEAAGQIYGQIKKYVYRGSRIPETSDTSYYVDRRKRLACICFKK